MADIRCSDCGQSMDQSDSCAHASVCTGDPRDGTREDIDLCLEGIANLWQAVRRLERQVAAMTVPPSGTPDGEKR